GGANGGQGHAVGAERHRGDRAAWDVDGPPVLLLRRAVVQEQLGHVPQPHGGVTAGGQRRAVRAERYRGHRSVAAEGGGTVCLVGGDIPQPDHVIVAAGGQDLPVGAERHRVNNTGPGDNRVPDRA